MRKNTSVVSYEIDNILLEMSDLVTTIDDKNLTKDFYEINRLIKDVDDGLEHIGEIKLTVRPAIQDMINGDYYDSWFPGKLGNGLAQAVEAWEEFVQLAEKLDDLCSQLY